MARTPKVYSCRAGVDTQHSVRLVDCAYQCEIYLGILPFRFDTCSVLPGSQGLLDRLKIIQSLTNSSQISHMLVYKKAMKRV